MPSLKLSMPVSSEADAGSVVALGEFGEVFAPLLAVIAQGAPPA